MSWELSTSPSRWRGGAPPAQPFRMADQQPFDARVLAFQSPLGGRCRTQPLGASSSTAQYDAESQSLLGKRSHTGMELSSAITLCAALCLWFMVLVVLGAMYWTATSSVAVMRDAARPFFLEAVNHTLSVLRHADSSTLGVTNVVDSAVPALQAAMNRSSELLARMEALSQHPVLQLSLTQGAVAPVG